jgi:hypothetical protein
MTDEKSPRDLIGPFLPLIRPYSDTKGTDELGSYEAKAKELVNGILGILDMRLASGKLTQEEFDDILAEKFRIEANFAPLIRNLRLLDPRLAEVSALYLWQLIGAGHRAGQLVPDAKILKEKSSLGGFRSGATRRKNAEDTWQPHALELARQSRERDPYRSRDGVVEDVSTSRQLTEPKKAPGRSTLKPFISRVERDGRLPKAKKNMQTYIRPVKRFT